MPKNNGHQKYFTSDGFQVPGVTTVLGVLAKPALVPWANKLGLKGIEVGKYVDDKADIGTMAHGMIEAHLKGEEFDTSDYSKNQISLAENCALKFYEWLKNKDVKVLGIEMQLVSDKHRFGGTCDIYCELNGVPTLIDIKTAKGIYEEMHTQVAAYKLLLEEAGKTVDNAMILRVGRDESEGFEEANVSRIELHVKRFLAALEIYNINKALKEKEA